VPDLNRNEKTTPVIDLQLPDRLTQRRVNHALRPKNLRSDHDQAEEATPLLNSAHNSRCVEATNHNIMCNFYAGRDVKSSMLRRQKK
jgi:hypothetical protein